MMSSQPPSEHHHDEGPMNLLLDEFIHLQETSTPMILLDDDHHPMNLLLPTLDHNSSASIYLQEHVISDDHPHKPTSETRGKDVAVVVDEHHHEHHEHGHEHDEDGGGGSSKKQEHNAKERLRRMKLQASYLALGTLLPDSPASKKKWSAPTIIDGVLVYVPELQAEVEQLTLRKQQILTAMESKKRSDKGNKPSSRDSDPVIPAVSVFEVGRDREVIVQICARNEGEEGFADLMHTMESQGMSILSASSAQVCADQRIFSYHLHVKMHEDLRGADNITVMREKIISSLV